MALSPSYKRPSDDTSPYIRPPMPMLVKQRPTIDPLVGAPKTGGGVLGFPENDELMFRQYRVHPDDDEKKSREQSLGATYSRGRSQRSRQTLHRKRGQVVGAESAKDSLDDIFIGTWNVGATMPSAKTDLTSWLFPGKNSDHVEGADIYVLGLQELVDLDAFQNYIPKFNAAVAEAGKVWAENIRMTLFQNTGSAYSRVAVRCCVGVMLCVFAKKSVEHAIDNVVIADKGVGKGNVLNNKCGVGISMKIFDSKVVFVCSHLEAHKNSVAERNKDYHQIIDGLHFKRDEDDQKQAFPETVEEHDMIFWLGDLNYRLNFKDLGGVKNMIAKRNWHELLQGDQLKAERDRGNAFKGFNEADIKFGPTYKFEPGTSRYNFGKEKNGKIKERFPAWCDRIMWRRGSKCTAMLPVDVVKKPDVVHCARYHWSMEQTLSDHKPVFALMKYIASKPVKKDCNKIKYCARPCVRTNEGILHRALDCQCVFYN